MDPKPPPTDTLATDSEFENVLRAAARAPELSIDGGLLSAARTAGPETRPRPPGGPPHIEDYESLEPLGEGGMGVVYRARQKSTGRGVALKLLAGPRRPHPEALRRFEREIRVLGRLQHPRIANLYGAGATDDGTPFFAMELIDGLTLDRFTASCPELRRRLELFRQVCDAVGHAHRGGVIHRDLKPSNVMVCRSGQDVKVLDFGLARLEEPEPEEAAPLTRTGAVQGTLAYMSPEQLAGAPVTTLSDVYSLGVILYELVAGMRPHEVSAENLRESLRRVCEERPRAPSAIGPRHPRAKDLDAIVLKALEKEPTRRYQSVTELSGDIENYMTNQPVLPGQIRVRIFRTLYTLGLFCRRNRAAVIVGTVASLLLAGLGAFGIQRLEAQRSLAQRRLAELYQEQGRQEVLAGNFSRASVYLGEALQMGGPRPPLQLLLARALQGLEAPALSLPERPGVPGPAAFSPAGDRFLTLDAGGTAHIWDLNSGRVQLTLDQGETRLHSAAFSPDGARIVTVHRDGFSVVTTWDPLSGRRVSAIDRLPSRLTSAELSPDGTRLLVTFANEWASVLDATTGKRVSARAGGGSFTFGSSRGDRLDSYANGVIKSWDLLAGRFLGSKRLFLPEPGSAAAGGPDGREPSPFLEGVTGSARSDVLSRDGSLRATNSGDGSIEVRSTADNSLIRLLKDAEPAIRSATSAAFSPDNKRLVTGSPDGGARIWELSSGKRLATLTGPPGLVFSVGFSPDGQRVVTGNLDGTSKIWDVASGRLVATFEGGAGGILCAAFSPDGSRIVTAGEDQATKIWRAEVGERSVAIGERPARTGAVAFSPDGRRVATSGPEGLIQMWDVPGGKLLSRLQTEPAGRWSWLSFTPDGSRIFTAGPQGLALWDPASEKRLAFESVSRQFVDHAVLSPDGTRLFVRTDQEAEARSWAAEIPGWSRTFGGPAGAPLPAASHIEPSDGEFVISSEARVLEAGSGRVLAALQNPTGFTASAFSPDGSRILTGTIDGKAKLWDSTSGRLLASLDGGSGPVFGTAFSPDGRWIAVVGHGRPIEVWEASGAALLLSLGGSEKISSAVFSPDGTALATVAEDGSVRLWDLTLEARGAQDVAALLRCRAPWRLEEGRLAPATPDAAACR